MKRLPLAFLLLVTMSAFAECDLSLFQGAPIVIKADCGESVTDIAFYLSNPETPAGAEFKSFRLPFGATTGYIYLILSELPPSPATFGATANDGKIGIGEIFTIAKSGAPPPPPTPAACVYMYGAWGACQPSGSQTRTLLSSSPAGCVGTPVLSQACFYVPPSSGQPSFPWTIMDVQYHTQGEFDAAVAAGAFGSEEIRINGTTVRQGFGPGIDGTSP